MPSTLPDDYYALLGVDARAGAEELRAAWRSLAARWHPDRAGEGATGKFQAISRAYGVLSDPVARLAYDRRRRARGGAAANGAGSADGADGGASPAGAGPAGSTARPARPAAPGVMLSRLSRPFAVLLACGAATVDESGLVTLVLSPAEAAQGGMATIPMRVDVWCPDCRRGAPAPACARCAGRGTVEELFSAWLAVPPGVAAGEMLAPTVQLPGMVDPVRFRVRLSTPRHGSPT